MLEETGLELGDIRFELVQDCIEPPEFYKKAHFLLLNYTATATSTKVTLNDEAENYRWLSPETRRSSISTAPPASCSIMSDLIRIVDLEVFGPASACPTRSAASRSGCSSRWR